MDRRRNLMADVVSGGGMEMTDFELVGTKVISEPINQVEFTFKKPCKEFVVICENITASADRNQVVIKINKVETGRLAGANTDSFISNKNNIVSYVKHIGDSVWMQLRKSSTYPNTTCANAQISIVKASVSSVESIAIAPQYSNINFTAGTFSVYAR